MQELEHDQSLNLQALVVDDDPIARRFVEQILRKHNYRVYQTDDFRQAVQAFITLKPSIIILDQHLDGFRGLDLAYFIRSLDSDLAIEIILHTMESESEIFTDSKHRCVDTIVYKGNTRKLMSVIQQHGHNLLNQIQCCE